MLNRKSKGFSRKSPHIKKVAWSVHAIMRWHSQCVGWSGYRDSSPKVKATFFQSRFFSGPGLKWLLICPRQPVGQGFGSLSGVRGDISVMSACLIVDLAFLIVDLTFDGQPHLLQVRRRPPCSDGFPCFGSHPSQANGAGASVQVAGARCTGCSSKLCLSFGPFEPRSLQQRRLHKNYNFGTAMNYMVEFS